MSDPTELARLEAKLVTLQNLRDSGLLSIRTPEGRNLTYQTGAELRAAIVSLKEDIAQEIGSVPARKRTFRLQQSGTGY